MYVCMFTNILYISPKLFFEPINNRFLVKAQSKPTKLGISCIKLCVLFRALFFLLARTWDRIQPRVDHPQKRLDVYPNVDCEIRKPFGKRLHDCGKIHYFQ